MSALSSWILRSLVSMTQSARLLRVESISRSWRMPSGMSPVGASGAAGGSPEAVQQGLVGCFHEEKPVADALAVELVEATIDLSKYWPPRTSLTTATRWTLLPSRPNRSAAAGIIRGGRLSIQKNPASSKAAMAWDLPAPERPVMIVNSILSSGSHYLDSIGLAWAGERAAFEFQQAALPAFSGEVVSREPSPRITR